MSDVVKLRYIDFVPPAGCHDATHGHVLQIEIGERTKRVLVDMSGTAFHVLKQMTAQPMALLLMDTVVRSEEVLRKGMSGFEALGDVSLHSSESGCSCWSRLRSAARGRAVAPA